MIVEVKQKHIEDGEPCNGFRCATALAMNEQVPGGPWKVGECEIFLASDKTLKTVAALPAEAQQFIELYDTERGKQLVTPFSFEIPDL